MIKQSPKQAFLLSDALYVSSHHTIGTYDTEREMNILMRGNQTTPTVLSSCNLLTESKTFAAPSDDDPDQEAEFCY